MYSLAQCGPFLPRLRPIREVKSNHILPSLLRNETFE